MNHYNSPIHCINADKKINLFQKFLWIILNFINNHFFPNIKSNFEIKHFSPFLLKQDLESIDFKSSPSRVFSNLFWKKINWLSIKNELEEINIFDCGCGNGKYSLLLQEFSSYSISNYFGTDLETNNTWNSLSNNHSFITFKKSNICNLLNIIPKNINLFISQSAIEHFENDLQFFHNINKFIQSNNSNTIQIHIFPSSICLKLYSFHGIRQYTPRTISKITDIFDSDNTYSTLYELGGDYSNKLHHSFITKPIIAKRLQIYTKKFFTKNKLIPTENVQILDYRETKKDIYKKKLLKAINHDINHTSRAPGFYALVIHSNYKEKIFKNMNDLNQLSIKI